jgi:lambda family phage tail tape measure protein
MTTKLSSLRVTSEMDSTGFVAGANAVVEANKRLIESDKARGSSLAAADAMLQKLPPSLASLSKALVTGYTEAAKFNADLKRIANSFDQSNGAVSRYAELYESLVLKYNMVAGASQLMAQNHKALIPVIEQVNAKLFAQIDIAERAAYAQRTSAGARAYQTELNSRLGVRTDFGSDARGADIAAYGAEMERLAAKASPAAAAMQAYAAEVEQANAALRVGAVSQAQYSEWMARAQASLQNVKVQSSAPSVDPRQLLGMGAEYSAESAAQAFIQEEQAIARVNKELERRSRLAAESDEYYQRSLLRGVDQTPLNQLLGVRDAGAAPSAQASAQAFIEDEQAIARVTAELDRRNAATQAAVREEQSLRAALDPSIAAMDRYTQGLQRAQAAFSRHGDIALYRQQVAALQQELQNAGTKNLSTTGVDPNVLTGRQRSGLSQSDFEILSPETVRRTEQMEQAAKLLRLEIDPLGEALKRLKAEEASLAALRKANIITTQEEAAGMVMAQQRYNRSAELIQHVGTGLRLSRHEMANLSYQFNDIAVMLASGQAPFMLFMQQGMQIAQNFTGLGLGEAIREIGTGLISFLLNPLNLAVVGFAAATAAAAYFFSSTTAKGPTLEEHLQRMRTLADELAESLGTAAENFGKVSAGNLLVLDFTAQINVNETKKKIQEQIQSLIDQYSVYTITTDLSGDDIALAKDPSVNRYIRFVETLKTYQDASKAGAADAGAFREEITKIGLEFPEAAKEAAELVNLLESAEVAQRRVNAQVRDMEPLMRAARRAMSITNPLMGDAPTNASLYSMIPDNRGPRQQLNDTYRELVENAGEMGTVAKATDLYQQSLAHLNAELEKTQQLAALDLQMIYAKSPAEKARLAGERERVSALNTAIDAEEVNIRVQNASAQAYAQATFAIAEQNRQRMRAANDNLASARLNTSLTGATPWDAAEAQANLQSFLDLRSQAEDNGIAFDGAQYERLKAINAELAEQNRLTAIRKLDLDIGNERRGLYRSEAEGGILQRLDSAGIKEGTDEFERMARALREIEDIEASFGYGFRRGFEDLIRNANDFAGTTQEFMSGFNQQLESVWVNVAKTGKIEWTSMIDFMIEETSRLLYQMASSSVLNMLAGSAGGSTGSPGIWSGLINMVLGGSSGLYAKGGAFYGGREITAFANGGVVGSPTYFPMAGGRTGLMGEAGPEAVMPLRRGRDGRLGVAAAGGGDTIAVSLQTSIDARGATPDMKQYIERALDARDKNLRRQLPGLVTDARQRGKAA